MQLPPGTVVGDRYVVDGPLGQGGMAVVYRVHHKTLGTAHALKIVGATSGSARERLIREGRLQGQLQHPNVVAVTDQLEIQGVPALVLELVDGPTLSQLLPTPESGLPPLPVEQLDALGAGILSGVGAAHRLGLVHRDLKPGNVLVAVHAQPGGGGRAVPKVTDFGLAVDPDSDDRRTRTGVSLGTPEYMAPEQVRNSKDVDARADVWALGVLLYELSAGVVPFEDPDRLALFTRIASATYTPLRDRRPDLPDRMYAAVDAALRPDRADRPADADALLAIWCPDGARDVSDALAARARSLAPSSVSGSSFATALPPAATWAPPPDPALETPPPTSGRMPPAPRFASASSGPTDESGRGLVEELHLHQPPAVREGAPLWLRVAGAGGAGALALGGIGSVLLLVLVGIGILAVLVLRPAPAPQIVHETRVVPQVVVTEPEDDGPRFQPPTKALDALADGRFGEASKQGSYFVASSDEAPFLVATADEARGSAYAAREELSKTVNFDPLPRGLAFARVLAADQDLGDAWLADHPGDLELLLWRLWAVCPGDRCATVGRAAVVAIAETRPSRGIADYADAVQRRAVGDLDGAAAAIDRWAAQAPEEGGVVVERARLAVARGDWQAVVDADAELAKLRDPGAAAVVAIADLRLGRDVHYPEAVRRGFGGTSMNAWAFAAEVAPTLEALDRGEEALALLADAAAKLGKYDDALVRTFLADCDLGRVELAFRLGHKVDLVQITEALRSNAAEEKRVEWQATRTRRAFQVADGLMLLSRGDDARAARRLAELREIGVAEELLAPLATALGE